MININHLSQLEMALTKLPENVRSLLCAVTQINNFKTAIAELIYNSLDAASTSIAVRVHIQENCIQVIDNGCGIAKNDIEAVGQRYMTSKLTDLSTLTSMPNCYGYRGEFLANIIQISHSVKIISRHKDGEETWVKTFHEGKKKQFAIMTSRPSKGTTVEVRGFLYNLNIQKRSIDPVNELQNIKSFLEQLSVAHSGISLSLRDDSKNEIIYKIHKKRDVYQTLSTLFNVERTMLQELQVEKNQYKVKGFIGKTDINIGRQWIYLNGRFLPSNKLHKIINKNFNRYLLIDCKRISKSKNNDGDNLFKHNLPFYFVFITCPYIDYHINFLLNSPIIEFKNWKQIKIMLEKLVKFYLGEINIKENCETEQMVIPKPAKVKNNGDTQDKIKNIIHKILGSNSKKLGALQLQHGVKGKLINRKHRKKKNHTSDFKTSLKKEILRLRCDVDKSTMPPNKRHCSSDNTHITIPNLDTSIPHPLKISPSKLIDKNTNNNPVIRNYNNKEHLINNKKKSPKHKNKYFPNKNKNKHLTNKPNITNPLNKITMFRGKNNINKRQSIPNASCEKKLMQSFTNERANDENINQPTSVRSFPARESNKTGKRKDIAQEVKELHKKHRKCYILKTGNSNNFNTKSEFLNPQYQIDCDKLDIIPKNMRKMYDIEKNIMHKIKFKPLKTTYDLVQTIFESQLEKKCFQIGTDTYPKQQPLNYKVSQTKNKTPSYPKLLTNDIISEYQNINSRQELQTMDYNISNDLASHKFTENTTHRSDIVYGYYDYTLEYTPFEKEHQSLRCKDLFKERSDILDSHEGISPKWSNIPLDSILTYESHKYNKYIYKFTKQKQENTFLNQIPCKKLTTKQSSEYSNLKHNSLFKSSNLKLRHKKLNKKLSEYYSQLTKQTVDKTYIKEFTKSTQNNLSIEYTGVVKSQQYDLRQYYQNNKRQRLLDTLTPNYEPTINFGNTYIVRTYSLSPACNINYSYDQVKYSNFNQLLPTEYVYCPNTENNILHLPNTMNTNNNLEDQDNIIFLSKPQYLENKQTLDSNIHPIELCEIVLSTNKTVENESDFQIKSNNCYTNNFGGITKDQNKNTNYNTHVIKDNDKDILHHFSSNLTTNAFNNVDDIETNSQKSTVHLNIQENKHFAQNTLYMQNKKHERNEIIEKSFNNLHNNFDFKDRLRFLPKGMSQIFEKYGSKSMCDYNLDKEYYEDVIYNNFVNNVQIQAEIYEPVIKPADELTTKDIYRFKSRVQKDNTALVFDKSSLKAIKVLNQVDYKFIAAIITEKQSGPGKYLNYLVLFDQHAVHERISLEQNLADYFVENMWKSVPLDNVILKMAKDEIIFLHNYKDKFHQLGLQWMIVDKNEVSISSIPQAILGKNPREVNKVMKAVRNLIVEQIGIIKLQKGCISLYPKSIMDLVCNEACRYAIKFGDKLSKSDCIDLINNLSNCKTPYQCAHGRPVMAVLVEINNETRNYKIDIGSLKRFKLKETKSKVNTVSTLL